MAHDNRAGERVLVVGGSEFRDRLQDAELADICGVA
jgi:hypothetical protein